MKTSNFIKQSLKSKINILFFSCLFLTHIAIAQEGKVVAVDGSFTNKDSAYVINHLGKDFIKEMINISPDSAQILIGEAGKFGILCISTIDPKNEKSTYYQSVDNKLFIGNAIIFIDDKEVDQSKIPQRISPREFSSIRYINQLESAQLYGKEKKCGVIILKSRE